MSAGGRTIDQDCYDNNPGSWHLGVLNQLGLRGRSLVLDVTYDYEVWNQPIYSYNFVYFNPKNKNETDSLAEALIPIEDYTKDKFKKYRSKDAVSIVGVAMDVTYVVENNPTPQRVDSAADDSYKSVRYLYDLELDRAGNIIGGEWMHNLHPDFLWTPSPNARALTAGDRYLIQKKLDKDSWDSSSSVPQSWRPIAKRTTELSGSPLALIVEELIQRSRVGL
jgi:hypothetical protein